MEYTKAMAVDVPHMNPLFMGVSRRHVTPAPMSPLLMGVGHDDPPHLPLAPVNPLFMGEPHEPLPFSYTNPIFGRDTAYTDPLHYKKKTPKKPTVPVNLTFFVAAQVSLKPQWNDRPGDLERRLYQHLKTMAGETREISPRAQPRHMLELYRVVLNTTSMRSASDTVTDRGRTSRVSGGIGSNGCFGKFGMDGSEWCLMGWIILFGTMGWEDDSN